MLAIDTNIIVRYLTGDHPRQSVQAKTLIDTHEVFVCTTVFLETEWVLRSAYGFSAPKLAQGLRAFAGHPNVTLEDPAITAQALEWMEHGLDFADALHLAKSQDCEAFISFDRNFAKAANKLAIIKTRAP